VELEFEELPAHFVAALPTTVMVIGHRVTVPLEVDSLAMVLGLARRFNARLTNISRSLDFESAYLALLEERLGYDVNLP
jgi:hypothetical protein